MFYTRKGDNGVCDLGSGKRVPKTDSVIAAVGMLDELNSFLGLVRNQQVSVRTKRELLNAQEKLFIIQAQVAILMMGGKKGISPSLPNNAVGELETVVDSIEKSVKLAKHFIIPGACGASAWLDCARTVARRAELAVIVCNEKSKKKLGPLALVYLNRLSSLLYALARAEVKRAKKKEPRPSYK
ncbi:MAG TPA: cob(I)yrinic acid a,c-diamide adenosyltransferase [Candidatus Vogelbacteria bacterium]|uniref:Corrinoid adenosyltransferase n=1 Tax=Candidatus Vogelbacteria bacterium RIFOXYD1_FULL_51_18 TaxID=1802440 RepID=A0A1G2QIU0_9BACT|nr:MAG: ATP/cobalamin adenosyltransferase [Parcubacteria group bacterium GW2011_GWC1_51_35]KKW25230.1 MAG: ATP:cob(I)alamin adenosyltransferase [Parcubacteria group bacterium GW2011_GWF2_52_12]KKW26092.1 MAG: ATP:cob(I)alamin adenosyltransferase [Parcubacteria group bacterium GW2011_GWF1_52_5]KKW34893.1 MAG: ATP:cob(I)alamin adenosyltransferase [Parcubacteria group bacterium GW2011_GWB1_53_43]OHA59881.1 MAG: ATP:cob(I)alamin adenosyltransferase [Candidatus Vogelbacteria bacterium RIFOXYD1_FULL_